MGADRLWTVLRRRVLVARWQPPTVFAAGAQEVRVFLLHGRPGILRSMTWRDADTVSSEQVFRVFESDNEDVGDPVALGDRALIEGAVDGTALGVEEARGALGSGGGPWFLECGIYVATGKTSLKVEQRNVSALAITSSLIWVGMFDELAEAWLPASEGPARSA